ncbi:GAF and ANTAR domain-containing protein [Geodermatophilaceae bacterium NBWT11]|nr:GAF and ANTAR domain-containing protein [Geodermatophilaceae bacterium NBWT11]
MSRSTHDGRPDPWLGRVTNSGPAAGAVRVADVLAALVSRGDRSTWAASLVEDCARACGAVGVGLAVADASGPVGIVAATPGAGRAGEDLQFALGEGPCRQAADTRRLVQAPVLAGDPRWVQFAAEAERAGICAAFSTPLQVGAVLIGVLDVYRGSTGALSDGDAATLAVYSQVATAVLLLLGDTVNPVGDEERLAELADIRPVVHQAAGMAAVQLDTDLATALVRLRGHAFATGRPLRDLAFDIVTRRLRMDDTAAGQHPAPAPSPTVPTTEDHDSPPDPAAAGEGTDRPEPPDFKQRNH